MVVVVGMSRVVIRLRKLLCSRLTFQPMSLQMAMTMSIQYLETYLAKCQAMQRPTQPYGRPEKKQQRRRSITAPEGQRLRGP